MHYEVREIEDSGVFRLWDVPARRWLRTSGGGIFETTSLTGALWVAKTLNK